MELVYASEALRSQCTNVKAAKKLFHGDLQLSVSLLSRINALEQADVLKDIVVQPAFHFINLNIKVEEIWKDILRSMSDPEEIHGGSCYSRWMKMELPTFRVISIR